MSREKEDSNWTDDSALWYPKKKKSNATSSQSRYIQTRARSKNTYSTTYFNINNYDQNTTTTTITKQRICLPFPRTLPPSLPLKRCPPLLPPSDLTRKSCHQKKIVTHITKAAFKTTKSEKIFEEAQDLLPGGVNSPVRAFKSVGGQPIVFDKVKGACALYKLFLFFD